MNLDTVHKLPHLGVKTRSSTSVFLKGNSKVNSLLVLVFFFSQMTETTE